MNPLILKFFFYFSQISFLFFVDKQVFKDLDFLGWYTTGNRPTEQDVKVHKQICEINECPIMLQLSPQSRNFDVSQVNSQFWINVLENNFRFRFFPFDSNYR